MSRTVSRTFLFTDLVGSTPMLERLGPAGDDLLRRHFTLLRAALGAHGGREVKNLGDGLMVTFDTAAEGAACAAAMQHAIARHNAGSGPEFELGLRVGVHSGEAISEGGDYFGMPVVIAKRLCDRCDAGQVLVSGAVRSAAGTAGGQFADVGSLWLKGLSDPVPASELDWATAHEDTVNAADARGDDAANSTQHALPTPLSTLAARELVGRRSELAVLGGELVAAQRGVRRLVLLAGEPGIGKTRLATELATYAHADGAVVLYGRCDEGGLIPFQPFVEALGRWIEQLSDAELQRRPEDDLAALAKLLPVLRTRLPWLPETTSGDAETERYRLFEAVVALLDATAQHGSVVLVLDDLHWADPATLLILKHLMRSPTPSALLVVGTYRDVEVGHAHPFASVMHDLRRERVPLERLEMAGLSQDEVTDLITSWAGSAAPEWLTRAVWQETEGHPFFVEEVLRHLLETGEIHEAQGRFDTGTTNRIGIPESVRSVVESRLARLDEQTQRVLSIGAIVGREFSAAVLEKVSGLAPDALFELLEEAAAARLVVETQGGAEISYRFSHALIQESLYNGLARSRRAHLHMRVGEALEELGVVATDENVPGLAHHFFKAARTSEALDKAIEYAIRAARLAESQLAYEGAAEQLENALHGLAVQGGNLSLQCDLLLSLGENRWNSGEYGQARDAFGRAAAIAERMRSPSQLAAAALGLGGRMGMPLEGGMVDTQLIETLEKALRMVDGSDSPLRARMTGRLASALLFSQRDTAEQLGHQAIAMARRIDDPALIARILTDTWLACWRVGNLDERLRTAAEMEKLATQAETSGPLLEARLWRTATMFEAGQVAEAEAHLDLSQVLVDELRQSYYTWFHTLLQAGRAIMHGDLGAGEQLMWRAVETGQTSDNPCAAELFAPQVLHLRILQGRCAEIHGGSKSISEHFHTIPAFRAGLAAIYADLGLATEARREFERIAVNDFGDVPDDVFWLSTIVLTADVCAFLGDVRRAETLYRLLLPLAGRYVVLGSVSAPVGTIQRALGVLATLLDRFSAADEHLQRAAAFEQQVNSPPELARVRCAQARMLVARAGTGDLELVAPLLDEAAEIATVYRLDGIAHTVAQLRASVDGNAPANRPRRSLGEVADSWRYGARAVISTRGRAAMARLVGDGSDTDLEKRFGSPLALRSVMTAMARGFQPSMAFGFEGEIQFEILPSRSTRRDDDRTSEHWWTIEVHGTKATARHRPADDPLLTIHTSVADFVRLIAGAANPVTMWIDKRAQVEGDITLANRLVEMFGGEEPLDIRVAK